MSRASIKISEGRLPVEIAAVLEPGLREALDNPTRREVVRILNSSDRALGVGEIAAHLCDFTVSEIGYHARVLERSGGVVVDDDGSSSVAGQRRYISSVADNMQALSALRATQRWDRNHRRTGDRHSSAHLTMFRVPRPVRTIRLGEREGGDREERS